MKHLLLFIMLCLSLVGCTTTSHYEGVYLPWSDKAVVLTDFSGDGFSTSLIGVHILDVEPKSVKTQTTWDKSKMEFIPGTYTLKLNPWVTPAFLGGMVAGAVGGQAALTVYLYGGSDSREDGVLELTLEAGKIYIVRLGVNDFDEPELFVSEY